MSVRSGRPVRAFMSARAFRPASRPGPRYEVREVRLALSYEALKIAGTPHRRAMSRTVEAISSACCALSITHGPAINASGCPPPIESGPIWTGFTLPILCVRHASRADADGRQFAGLVPVGRLDEA